MAPGYHRGLDTELAAGAAAQNIITRTQNPLQVFLPFASDQNFGFGDKHGAGRRGEWEWSWTAGA